MRIQANDLQVGDTITSGPRMTMVRELQRGDDGRLVTNPGSDDEIKGNAWEWVDAERPTALTAAELDELRERTRREAGPFVQARVLDYPVHNPEWATAILGRPASSAQRTTWPERYLLYLAARAEPTPPPPPMATARLAQYRAEEDARRQAEAHEHARQAAEWKATASALHEHYGVRIEIRHNYTSARHLDGYRQGGDHVWLLDALNVGRLRRDADNTLCYVPSKAKDLQHLHHIDDGRLPDCKACLTLARRLAERAPRPGPNETKEAPMKGYKITNDSTGEPVREGDQLKVDNNLPVTFLGIETPPWGDDDADEWYPGQVRVRYSWGAVETVAETRAGVTIQET